MARVWRRVYARSPGRPVDSDERQHTAGHGERLGYLSDAGNDGSEDGGTDGLEEHHAGDYGGREIANGVVESHVTEQLRS